MKHVTVNYTYTITHHLSLSVIFKTNPNYVNQKFGGHLTEVTIIGKLSSEFMTKCIKGDHSSLIEVVTPNGSLTSSYCIPS